MPGPQYSSNAPGLNPFDVDTVTITRRTEAIVSGNVQTTTSTIYSGVADFQEGAGQIVYDPQGAVESIDAVCIIDTPSPPSFQVDDIVAAPDGRTFSVHAVINSTYALTFVKLLLRRGSTRNTQK
jgi:hypothetical protein